MRAFRLYNLSETGRSMTWSEWKEAGGCGLSGIARVMVARKCGPEARWGDLTLGELADASELAGREMGRFAKNYLKDKRLYCVEREIVPPKSVVEGAAEDQEMKDGPAMG